MCSWLLLFWQFVFVLEEALGLTAERLNAEGFKV